MPANFNGSDATAISPALQETPSQETPPRRKRLSTTSLLILCNALLFFAMLVHCAYIMGKAFGDELLFSNFDSALLLKWGSDYGPLTLTGQFWRVITSIFVHFNFLHLTGNMLFLWGFGRYLDRLFTRAQAFAIYLLTGAAGDILSLAWDPTRNSFGASGAIYGQAGVLIALLCFARSNFSRRDIRNLLLWIFFSMPIGLLWGHVAKQTDYVAHLGGVLCGFAIGALISWTFRLSPAERVARQRKIWQFAAVVLVVLFTIVMQVHRNTALGYAALDYQHVQTSVSNPPPRVGLVFLDLKGDPNLVRQFTDLFKVELHNAGIAMANNEHDADSVFRGRLKAQVEYSRISMGVVKMYINSQHGFQIIDSCRNLSTAEDTNLYEQSAANAAFELRARYDDARTVRLDPASDLAASRQFAAEFPSELKKSGLTMVQSGPADIALRIDLKTEKIPVEKDGAAYDIKIVAPDGAPLVESNGSASLSARLVGNAPAACPERLADLKWIYNDNTLSSIAHNVANNLHTSQPVSRADKPSKSKE